jgi:flagellar biosynthesis/type III secretory pathway chaperone
MESPKKLIQTLETMVDDHKKLLELANEKRNFLVEGNVEGLRSLTHQESLFVEEIQKLEQQRIQFVQEYMNRRGLTGQFFTLEELFEVVDEPASKASLESIAKKLRLLIAEITHLNESNQQLIETSLSYIQYSFGLLVRKEPSIGYGPHATSRYSNMLDAKA